MDFLKPAYDLIFKSFEYYTYSQNTSAALKGLLNVSIMAPTERKETPSAVQALLQLNPPLNFSSSYELNFFIVLIVFIFF